MLLQHLLQILLCMIKNSLIMLCHMTQSATIHSVSLYFLSKRLSDLETLRVHLLIFKKYQIIVYGFFQNKMTVKQTVTVHVMTLWHKLYDKLNELAYNLLWWCFYFRPEFSSLYFWIPHRFFWYANIQLMLFDKRAHEWVAGFTPSLICEHAVSWVHI